MQNNTETNPNNYSSPVDKKGFRISAKFCRQKDALVSNLRLINIYIKTGNWLKTKCLISHEKLYINLHFKITKPSENNMSKNNPFM